VPSITNHDLDAGVAPRDLRRLTFGRHRYRLPVDDEAALAHLDRALEAAVVAVVLEQVGVGLVVHQVVDGDDFQLVRVAFPDRFQDLPPNPAEAVDADAHCHDVASFRIWRLPCTFIVTPRTGSC
jgi:hypothetical protein